MAFSLHTICDSQKSGRYVLHHRRSVKRTTDTERGEYTVKVPDGKRLRAMGITARGLGNCRGFSALYLALVFYCCCNKLPQTSGHKTTQIYSLTVPEVRSPISLGYSEGIRRLVPSGGCEGRSCFLAVCSFSRMPTLLKLRPLPPYSLQALLHCRLLVLSSPASF